MVKSSNPFVPFIHMLEHLKMHFILLFRATCLFDNPDAGRNYHTIKNVFMYFLHDWNQCIKLAVPELFSLKGENWNWLALIVNNVYKNLYKWNFNFLAKSNPLVEFGPWAALINLRWARNKLFVQQMFKMSYTLIQVHLKLGNCRK